MRIYELLRNKGFDVITVRPGTPVAEVISLLREYNLGAVVISVDGRQVSGIVGLGRRHRRAVGVDQGPAQR